MKYKRFSSCPWTKTNKKFFSLTFKTFLKTKAFWIMFHFLTIQTISLPLSSSYYWTEKIPFFQKPWSCSQLSPFSHITVQSLSKSCWLHLQICSESVSSLSHLHPCLSSSHLIRAPSSFSQLILTGGCPASLLAPSSLLCQKGGVEGKPGVSCHSSAKTPHWLLSSLRVKAQVIFLKNVLFICIQ